MLLKYWMAWVIFLVLNVVLIIIGRLIAKKMNKNVAGGGSIGFVVGLTVLLMMIYGASHLYVVKAPQVCEHYLVYGDAEWSLPGGKKYTVQDVYGQCVVINETHKKIALEEIVYGGIVFSTGFYIAEPGEMQVVPVGSIKYFWDDSPPDEISVSEGTDKVSRWWLRDYRD